MTVNIRGKQYVTVAERVAEAHEDEEAHFSIVGGDIITVGKTDRWWYQATISVHGRTYIGTAEIKFNAKPNTADADSPLECAETSAIGRALAFAGYGAVESIASADEVRRTGTTKEPHSLRLPHPTGGPVVTLERCAEYAEERGIDREAYQRAIAKYGTKNPEYLLAALEVYADRMAATK